MSSAQAEPLQDKAALRRSLSTRRSAIDAATRQLATRSALEALVAWDCWRSAGTIALYRATGAELDPSALATQAQRAGQRLVYPRTLPGGVMHFHDPGQPPTFESGPADIEQPIEQSPRLAPDAIDLMVIPLLGCDDRGVRLGYGGGYYDRYLAQSQALRVGIGFGVQRVGVLPAEAHDVRLDWYVDEQGLQRLG